MNENDLTEAIIGSAIEVHRALGPGLLESVYQKWMGKELALRGVSYSEQVPVAVEYKGERFEAAYRIDMLVYDKIVVELKAIETILPVHEAQLLSYLRLTGKKLGLLISFHVPVLKSGIRRVVNNL
jgi:GxxExxY protein